MPGSSRVAGLQFENRYARKGFKRICGVDEVGRGPLAGPVVAAAVVLSKRCRKLTGICDSKMLSPKRREFLYKEIMADSAVGIGIVSERRIDVLNILRASIQAMEEAVRRLSQTVDCILIDGPIRLEIRSFQVPIPGGDRISRSVAAASIIAKVTRDRLMVGYHRSFPVYGFARHKGYPTPGHLKALREHGPSRIHRRSFAPVRCLLKEPQRAHAAVVF